MRYVLVCCWWILFGSLSACGGRPVAVASQGEVVSQLAQEKAGVSVAQREAQLIATVDEKNSVFFASSSVVLNAEAEQKMQQHVLRIKADPKLVVSLVGHTDDLGSRAYNMAIAEQRVNAVYGFLRRAGVPIRQLRRSGGASDIGAKSCDSAECRAKMRRVELIYPAP